MAQLRETDRTDDWEHLRALNERKIQLEEEALSLYNALEQLESTEID